ncbi:alpha/beta hydrolase fold protein [Rhodocollybia butyracea]|uniref:Alpha/beta hydrolase fold protein n=1 Tax=Rhodocollybia butyracea TaxID=206335 RepID=A0A9P5PYV9_9AGAR|nr:alpha/beta hydrolase fold protein [Rhodocollybia butyracea]
MAYQIDTLSVDGVELFYRFAGPKDGPILLLLHGFPTSSHQYRNLIPLLSHKYRVLAPDYPGFGFTSVSSSRNYEYTFANIANTISTFLDVLGITKFSMFIFDYGAPVGLRIALKQPDAVQAIISQNGNAYEEGLGGPHWAPRREYWATGALSSREAIRAKSLSFAATKAQYTTGTAKIVQPESYTLDWALMSSPEKQEIMLDFFKDYGTNVQLYPEFQRYFRESQVPLLAAWGNNDPSFIPPGAWAFQRDLPNAEVVLLDAGHFAAESDTEEIGKLMLDFLGRNGL